MSENKGTHWATTTSGGVNMFKSVVTKEGRVIGRNWGSGENRLQKGDAGVEILVNCSVVPMHTPTSVQLAALDQSFKAMVNDARTALGLTAEEDFKPGMIVKVQYNNGQLFYALVVQMHESTLRAKRIDDEARLVLTSIALDGTLIDEVPNLAGTAGLLAAHLFSDWRCASEERLHGAFVKLANRCGIANDQKLLERLINKGRMDSPNYMTLVDLVQSEDFLCELLVREDDWRTRIDIDPNRIASRISSQEKLVALVSRLIERINNNKKHETSLHMLGMDYVVIKTILAKLNTDSRRVVWSQIKCRQMSWALRTNLDEWFKEHEPNFV